jgi:hypothetical protein
MSEEFSCALCFGPAEELALVQEEFIVGVDAYGEAWENHFLTFHCSTCDQEFCIDLDPKKIMERAR